MNRVRQIKANIAFSAGCMSGLSIFQVFSVRCTKLLIRRFGQYAGIATLALTSMLLGATTPAKSIPWSTWSSNLFDRAVKEHRFVLLVLEDPLCQDCRDMDADTFSDGIVQRLIAKSYIAVRVDNNAKPDIANRYLNYQLPGIVIFNFDGSEIIRQQGYIPPRGMSSLLQAVIDDPSPGPSVKPEPALQYSASPSMAPAVLKDLQKSFDAQYDIPAQGWAFAVQYLDEAFVEYGLGQASTAGRINSDSIRVAIRRSRQLIDPAWGGVYESLVVPVTEKGRSEFLRVQISGRLDRTGDDWNIPRYRKTTAAQAQAIEIYTEAYQRWHDPNDLMVALNVAGFVDRSLQSEDGAFYTAQAGYVEGAPSGQAFFAKDGQGRKAIGVPAIDKNIYASENGHMLRALCALYRVTGDRHFLEGAQRSAQWLMQHRALRSGGFSHGEHDTGGPYLVDSIEVGRAFLSLYQVTHDLEWIKRAQATLEYVANTFMRSDLPGVLTSPSGTDPSYKPHANREENVDLMCFLADFAKLTGKHSHQDVADSAMRYLVTKDIATANSTAPVLLATDRYAEYTKGQASEAKAIVRRVRISHTQDKRRSNPIPPPTNQ